MNMLRKALSLAVCAMLLIAVVPTLAQPVLTGTTSVPLSFTVNPSVSINCTTPTFTVSGNTATSSTITCTSAWELPVGTGYGQGECVAQYFSSGQPFGSSGPASTSVFAAVNGGGPNSFSGVSNFYSNNSNDSCEETVGTLGAQFWGPTLEENATESLSGGSTDTEVITINTSGLAATTYSGNLNFVVGVR